MRKIFYHGKIETLDPSCPRATAIYVEDGKIAALGSDEEILLQFGRAGVEKVDLEGGYAYPGWVDSHMHLAMLGMKLSMLDLSGCRSKAEMLAKIRERAARTPPGEWITGLNWNEHEFADRSVPTLQELDEAAPHHPLFLIRTCYHVALANSLALQRAGITEATPDPEQGSFGRDAAGRLNGLIYENAQQRIRDAMPQPSDSERKAWVQKAMKAALSHGLTGVHTEDLREIQSVEGLWRIYREAVEEGLPLRTHHLIYYPYLEELKETGMTTGSGDEWVRIGALKIFADGSFGGRTAYLSAPYADDPGNVGMPIHTQEELNELTRQARQHQMPIAVHAIGDRAAEMAITAMETVPLSVSGATPYRDRLIHATLLREDLLDRLERLNVALDLQPRFVPSDFPWVLERLGPERLAYAYAWKTLISRGLLCGGGSDAPIEPLDPRLGLHAAITRRKPEEPGHEGYFPHERLTAWEALRLFTLGSAYAAGEERERGTLSVGKYADLTVVDRDLLSVAPDEILEASVWLTITNGVVGYRKG